MSYLVLARKWRPQTFEEVIGQGHVTRTLQNALKNDRVAHALLFSGPRGVGKTSVARILSKALNCERGPSPVPCNECSICRQITAGNNVDVNEIDGASNRGIDEIRQLREEIRFQPVQCRFRIYIIDEVHMLTKEAFNALLKTLEEPPAHAYFVFATTEPRKIPATIHSRCQHFEFRRLPEDDLADHLDKIVQKEGLHLPRQATLLLAREAEGSVRDGLSLLDQVAAYGASSYEEVCEALGVIGVETIEELAFSILGSDMASVLSMVDMAYRLGSDLQRLAGDLLKFFRDLAIIKRLHRENCSSLIEMDHKRRDLIRQRFRNCSFHQILQAMQIISSSMEDLYRSSDPRMSLEVLLMRLCTLKEFSSIDELIQQVEALLRAYQEYGNLDGGARPEGQGCVEQGHVYQGEREDGSLSMTFANKVEQGSNQQPDKGTIGIEERWEDFVEIVKRERPGIGNVLEACSGLKARDDSSVELSCPPDVTGEMLCDRENAARINRMAEEFFNRPVNIFFRMEKGGERNGHGNKGVCRSNGNNGRRLQLINSPLVQETINLFQARISNVTFYNRRKYKKTKTGD